MATIRIKRGTGTPGFAALSVGEPAINTNLNTLFIKTASAGNSTDVKLVGAEIEAQTAANGFNAINWGSASDSKLATQNAIETRFMPKAGGTFTGAVSFGQGSTAAGEIRLLEDTDDGSNYSAFRGSARAANITYVMPTTDPTDGQVLSAGSPSSNVSTLSWVDAGAASTVTITNDDTTTTLYPIFSTATSGSVSPKVDSDGMTYDAANDQLNGINIKASNLLILGDATDFEIQDFPANTILSGVFSTSNFNFIPVNGDFTTYNFVVAAGETQNNTINFGTGDLVSSTKTINIGTGGGSSTTTAINIGSTAGTSTTTNNGNLTVTGDLAVNGADITTTATGTATVFNTNATTVNAFGAATTATIAGASAAQTVNIATGATASGTKTLNLGTNGQLGSTTNVNIGSNENSTTTINSATLAGSALNATQNVFNTTHTTVNAFGAATALTMGANTTATTTIRGGTLVGNTTTQNVFNTTATTVNAFGAGTTVSIGAATGTTTVNNSLTVTGNLTVNGTTTTVNTNTLSVDDKNIEMGSVAVVTGLQATLSTGTANVTLTAGTTAGLLEGQSFTVTAGTGAFGTNAVIQSISSSTQLVMSVNHQTAGAVTFSSSGATNTSANGGGITLKGTTDKTIIWDSSNENWTSSEHFNLPTGKVYKINNAQINAGNLAASTSAALGVGTIELGHASDTTLSRSAAGVLAVEGVDVVTLSASQTLTNKSLTAPRITTGSHIADANGNELIVFPSAVGSAINEITISNAASGNNPSITASGGGTNISLLLAGKGTGSVSVTTPFLSNCASRSSGSASYFTITGPGDSGITASTESVGVAITPSPRQWATGALTTQREVVFAAPTYTFVGASTITTAVNVDIANPLQGANATITNAYALRAANTNITGTLLVNGTANATFSNTGTVSITPTSTLTLGTAGQTTTVNGNVNAAASNQTITLSPTGSGTVSIAPASTLTLGTAGVTTTVNGNVNAAASNQTVTLSPTGIGTVTIQPGGGLTINPTTAGNINNTNIGASTRGTGAFTTLGANNAVTIQTGTNNQSYTTTGAGTITISSGTAGSMDNMNIGATTAGTGRFSTITATSSITYNSAVISAAGTTQATATAITTVDVNFVTSGTGGVALPAAVAGRRIAIINRTSAAINVYPVNAGDDTIDGAAANAAYVLQSGEYGEFDCSSATAWFTNGTIDGGSY